jgi:hypothetical protein
VNRFETKGISHFAMTVVALMASPLFAMRADTVPVTATAGASNPAWAPYGEVSDTLLGATTTNPTPDTGSTLLAPYLEWTILTVETSNDGVNYSPGGAYEGGIMNDKAASTTLQLYFYQGAYWRITCQATVGFLETPGAKVWTGNGTCQAKPKSGELVSITVTSGATQTNVTGTQNWAAVQKSGDTVVVQATVKPDTADVANMIQWTGGTAVAGNKKQVTVDKGASAKTAVTAQIGAFAGPQEVDIWILWATIVNQFADKTPPNAVQFGVAYDGTEELGAKSYNGGNSGVGKVVPIATITPLGVNAVVKGAGWNFRRDKLRHDFVNGVKIDSRYDTTWQGDDTDVSFKNQTPDANDKIYDRDAPNITGADGIDSIERYDNFREYVQWNGDMCSDYTGWCYQARWKTNQAPQVTLNTVAMGALDLTLDMYTKAFYKAP